MVKHSNKRPPKHSHLLQIIKLAVESGNYSDFTKHAQQRQSERAVNRAEYEYVLKNGWHESAKDEYSEQFQSWKYAIRGKTTNDRDIRVVVAIDMSGLVVITLIAIGENNE